MTLELLLNFIKKPEIAAVILTAILAVIGRLLQPKAKVVWGVGHQFCHNVPQSNGGFLLIYSRNIFIKNMGKYTAKDIEIHFGFKPEHYQIWPPCNYTEATFPDNHFMIKLDHMGKKEYFNIELLQSVSSPPLVLKLRTVDGDCNVVNIAPQQVFPWWINITIFGVLLLGIYKMFEWILFILF